MAINHPSRKLDKLFDVVQFLIRYIGPVEFMDSEDEREIAQEIQYFADYGTYWRFDGTSLSVACILDTD